MSKIELTLILPCYNEAEHFVTSVPQILNVLHSSKISYEVIFIDDKSTDSTKLLIKKFTSLEKNNSKAIYHRSNVGRGGTVAQGIKLARGKYVGFIDIDCEISPRYIPSCIDALKKGSDIVCGHRRYDFSLLGFFRAVASKLYSYLVKWMLNSPVFDTEAGYKFFNKQKILPVLKETLDAGWFWDTEIMIRAVRHGLKIKMIPVEFKRRTDKTSTVHLIRDSLDYFIKLIKFRQRINK